MRSGRDEQRGILKIYRFGQGFELVPEARELRRSGRLVHVQPKPFDVLFYLLRNRRRVVSREELHSAVWPDVVVNEEALNYALHVARKVVGDDGSKQGVIQTIPRCGFRFVAPVEELEQEEEQDQVAGASGGARHGAGQRLRFVGRRRILSQVRAALGDVVGGRGRIVMLSGEAGIGKTRTAEELAEIAKERGCRVLLGRCIEAEGSPAFWPWVQVVRSFAQEELPESLLRILGEGAREIARMVPELREQFPDLPEVGHVDPKAARFLLFDGAITFFRRATEIDPLVLIFDDLHRADQPSLLLLQFLAREISGLRLLVIGTYREAELRADEVRNEPVLAVAREESACILGLEGLAQTEVGELVTAASGRVPSARAVESLHELTGGNPFFLSQVLQALESEGGLERVESSDRFAVTVPRRVQDLIARQLDALPPACLEFLEVAAVVGRDFQLAALELATERERGDALDILSPALAAGVIEEHETRIDTCLFSHVLVRDALYRTLSEARRTQLHARVGEALEELWGADSGPHCAALAHHFFQAIGIGEGERAIRYAVSAGEWASERAAFEEAPAQYERALEALDAVAPRDDARRCELLLALGDAQTKAGNREAARSTLERAARIARKVGLPEKLAEAALRFAPDFLAIETGVYDPALVALLEEALAALDTADSALRARLLARLAVALHWADESEPKRLQLCDEASAMAERVAQPETSAYVRSGRTLALYSMAHPEHYLNADPGGPLAPGDEPIALVLQLLRMTSLLMLGRISEFDTEIETFTALAEKLNQPQAVWYTALLRATRAQMQGNYKKARTWSQRFVEQGNIAVDRNATHSYALHLVMRNIDIGGIQGLKDAMKNMVESFPRVVGWRAGLALFLTEIGEHREAQEELERLLQDGALSSAQRNDWFAIMGGLALSSRNILDRRALEKLYSNLLPHSNHYVVIGYCSLFWGSVQHLLGILTANLKHWKKSESHFRSALAMNRRVGARACIARAQYDYAQMILNRGGRDEEAHDLLQSCKELAKDLGMDRLSRKAQDLREEGGNR